MVFAARLAGQAISTFARFMAVPRAIGQGIEPEGQQRNDFATTVQMAISCCPPLRRNRPRGLLRRRMDPERDHPDHRRGHGGHPVPAVPDADRNAEIR